MSRWYRELCYTIRPDKSFYAQPFYKLGSGMASTWQASPRSSVAMSHFRVDNSNWVYTFITFLYQDVHFLSFVQH